MSVDTLLPWSAIVTRCVTTSRVTCADTTSSLDPELPYSVTCLYCGPRSCVLCHPVLPSAAPSCRYRPALPPTLHPESEWSFRPPHMLISTTMPLTLSGDLVFGFLGLSFFGTPSFDIGPLFSLSSPVGPAPVDRRYVLGSSVPARGTPPRSQDRRSGYPGTLLTSGCWTGGAPRMEHFGVCRKVDRPTLKNPSL